MTHEREQTWNGCQEELSDLILWLAESCNQKTGPVTNTKITVYNCMFIVHTNSNK